MSDSSGFDCFIFDNKCGQLWLFYCAVPANCYDDLPLDGMHFPVRSVLAGFESTCFGHGPSPPLSSHQYNRVFVAKGSHQHSVPQSWRLIVTLCAISDALSEAGRPHCVSHETKRNPCWPPGELKQGDIHPSAYQCWDTKWRGELYQVF